MLILRLSGIALVNGALAFSAAAPALALAYQTTMQDALVHQFNAGSPAHDELPGLPKANPGPLTVNPGPPTVSPGPPNLATSPRTAQGQIRTTPLWGVRMRNRF